MRKRKTLKLFVIALAIAFLIIAAAPLLSAVNDVAYILNNQRFIKSEITNILSEMNLSYEVIEDRNILKKDLSKYKIVFIDDAILRKTKKLPIYNYPSVIMNSYYGFEWGLTDDDGISSLASTAPLEVFIPNIGIKQVYTEAKYPGGASIPYFHLNDLNKAPVIKSIARSFVPSSGEIVELGDAVGDIQKGTTLINGKKAGDKMCFYGISKSKYWTTASKDLFKDCIESVLTECVDNSECLPTQITGNNYCYSNDVYRNISTYQCQNPGTYSSACVLVATRQLVQTCDDYCLNGQCRNFTCSIDSDCDDSNVSTQDICNFPGTINSSCTHISYPQCSDFIDNDGDSLSDANDPGCHSDLNANNPLSYNPADNNESNPAITCANNNQCGVQTSTLSCNLDNLVNTTITPTCFNASTVTSYCSNVSSTTSTLCSFGCNPLTLSCNPSQCADTLDNDGDSLIDTNDPGCHSDGNSSNPLSYDSLDNDETNAPIACYIDSDCGSAIRLGDFFCNGLLGQDLWEHAIEPVCNNPGTVLSYCSNNTLALLNQTCAYGCFAGSCISDTTAPVITLIFPPDYYSTEDSFVNFVYNVTDNSAIDNCVLNLNNGTYVTLYGDSSIFNGVANSFDNVTLTPGNYLWNISCTDDNNNTGVSETRHLIIGGSQILVHDVGFESNYDGFGNFIRLRDPLNNIIDDPAIINNITGLYDIQFRTLNNGNFDEIVNISCEITNSSTIVDSWTGNPIINISDSSLVGNRNNYNFSNYANGFYDITCLANITNDANPADNIGIRTILINFSAITPPTYACSDNIDNDGDSFIDTDDPGCHSDLNTSNPLSYDAFDDDESNPGPQIICSANNECGLQTSSLSCNLDNLVNTTITPTCFNPGTTSSYCSNVSSSTSNLCAYGCNSTSLSCNNNTQQQLFCGNIIATPFNIRANQLPKPSCSEDHWYYYDLNITETTGNANITLFSRQRSWLNGDIEPVRYDVLAKFGTNFILPGNTITAINRWYCTDFHPENMTERWTGQTAGCPAVNTVYSLWTS